MNVDETLLMAYVDGELPPARQAEVEALLATDSAEAAEMVKVLQASRVDYHAAFAAQTLPPVPASLTLSIEALVRQHQAAQGAAGPAAANADQVDAGAPNTTAPIRSRLRSVPAWLAAASVAVAFCGGLFMRTPPSLGSGAVGSNAMTWIAAAASYQRLYTRDTVGYAQIDAKRAADMVADIHSKDHLPVRVPDLSTVGLQFKSIQRLNFNNKPLVQIVYLPEKGLPIALCVIREPKPDATIAAKTVDSMHVVTWRQAELSYALIGNPQGVDLEAIGKQIEDRGVDQLFGSAATAVSMSKSVAAKPSPDV